MIYTSSVNYFLRCADNIHISKIRRDRNEMKKKVIVLAAALMLLMVGVVSAAAKWGTFEGYNIVKLVINGKTVAVEDTPPVILKGRTMVPLSMLEDAGLKATWDKDTYTVTVDTEANASSTKDTLDSAYRYDRDFIKRSNSMQNVLEITNTSVVSYQYSKEIQFDVNINSKHSDLSYYVSPALIAASYDGYFDLVRTDIYSEGILLLTIKIDVATVDLYATKQIDETELIKRAQVIEY
jgi:hypothetical protein